MSMNWLIDRLLVLGIVLVLAGAVAGLSMAGIRHAGAANRHGSRQNSGMASLGILSIHAVRFASLETTPPNTPY